MIYFFDIPEIIDDSDLNKIPQPMAINAQEQHFLQETQQLRQEFKNLCTAKKLEEIRELKDALANYSPSVIKYLRSNVDLLGILTYKKCNHPQFKYKTFLSKEKDYDTSKQTLKECGASEILMARYAYAFCLQVDCFPYLIKHRNSLTQTFQDQIEPKLIEDLIKQLTHTLEVMALGYIQVKKVYGVMSDLLGFLVEETKFLQPELKATTVYSIKLMLECNANSVYAEILRINGKWKELAELSKTSLDKLHIVGIRLNEIKDEIKTEILDFVRCGQIYFEALGYYGISKLTYQQIKNDDYTPTKKFTDLAVENISVNNQILRLSQQLKQELQAKCSTDDFYVYTNQFVNQLFCPFAQSCIAKYNNIFHNKPPIFPQPNEVLNQFSSKLDYFEKIEPTTKE